MRGGFIHPRWSRLIAQALAVIALAAPGAQADVFRWDNGEAIPGTRGIVLAPKANLLNMDLQFADLRGADLTEARLSSSRLGNADFSGAIIAGAGMTELTGNGFVREQLYATASYQAHRLPAINFGYNDLRGWDFTNQDLTGTSFGWSQVADADFSGALIREAAFTESGFTKEQLYSTASHQQGDLQDVEFWKDDLRGWDLSEQNLTGAVLWSCQLGGADFRGAIITDVNLTDTTRLGFARDQLLSLIHI